MRFGYDPAKSVANKAKHGIDFEEAQALWNDGDAVTQSVTASAEPRFLVTGKIGERLWTAVVVYRGERIRIISVRRARKHETEKYLGRGV